ncbi:unnamed protein product [Cylindrotheca closterium]|uniref:Uncharacterized protein n=1 Tax=Cylindrotheca closterium TaxID=2856 RepID=A0AAD2JJW6_9STRA|nr:unnamed protein product [Cylindrotheca closterium]
MNHDDEETHQSSLYNQRNDEIRNDSQSSEGRTFLRRLNLFVIITILIVLSIRSGNQTASFEKSYRWSKAADSYLVNSSKLSEGNEAEKSKSNEAHIVPVAKQDWSNELPACQIRVTNKVAHHYEVIESVAKLIPYEYLNLSDRCNHLHLHFEFDTSSSQKLRTKSWLLDMNVRVFNTSIVDETTGITRSFGRAAMAKPNRTSWDTTIQVTCHCDRYARPWLQSIKKNGPHVCIHHGRCSKTEDMPNAIQISPHHERYFIPSALPQVSAEFVQRKNDTKIEICSVGATIRQDWNLLVPFLENSKNAKYLGKIRIRMLGKGGFPNILIPYREQTEMVDEIVGDDREFYATVKACDIIILAISQEHGQDYFKSIPTSNWKLSGTIPPIVAYIRPFLIPDELVELYRAHLPMQVPHRGYNHANRTAFSEALSSLLDDFLGARSTTRK